MLNKLIMMLFFYPGHGPWDLATDASSSALIEAFIRITNLLLCMSFTSSVENVKVNGEF
jgi:hypothetical protein